MGLITQLQQSLYKRKTETKQKKKPQPHYKCTTVLNWKFQLFINKMSFQKCRKKCNCNDGALGCFLSFRNNSQLKASPLFTWIEKLCKILQLCGFSLGMMLNNSLLLQYSQDEKLLATVETSHTPFIFGIYYPK